MLRPVFVLACVLLLGSSARAADLPRYGGLYPVQGGQALALLDSDIEVTVRGPIVEAVVTQKFQNKTDQPTEATYVFPLPMDAAVSAMWIVNGNRTIKAAIEKRDEAQRRYEAAVRAGQRAALLDQERADVFTQTVSAIPAKGIVVVSLRYDSVARYRNGTWELVLPLVVAPRFVPGTATGRPTTGTGRAPDTDRAPDASRVTPGGAPGAGGKTDVKIAFVDKVDDVRSITHELKRAGAIATLVDSKSDHDMIVTWKAPVTAGWVEPSTDGGYAAVVVTAAPPPARKAASKWVLALDRSAASQGDADAVARPLVRQLLGAGDRVMVVGSDAIAWGPAADALRALEDRWAQQAGAFDLTRVLGSIRSDGAPIVLVSGGLVADDRAAVAAAKRLGVPVHVVGLGPAPARGLLEQIATATGGTVRYVLPGDDFAALARATLADLAAPPAPLTITWGTLAVSDVVPASLPRLASGQAIVVLAKVKRAQTANVRTRGDLFAIETLPGGRAADGATTSHGPLARRWARNRLDELLVAHAAPDAIAAHALAFGLVSPHTSMVAIGTEIVVQGGVKRSTAIPVSVPAGMKWQAVKQQQLKIDATAQREPAGGETVVGRATPPPPPPKPVAKRPTVEPRPDPRPVHPRTDRTPITAGPRREPTTATRPPEERPEPKPAPAAPVAPRDVARTEDDAAGAGAAEAEDGDEVAATGSDQMDAPTMAESITVAGDYSSGRSRLRISTSFGAGLSRYATSSSGLLALGTRLEYGRRSLFGLDASLWLVDGDGVDVQGRALFSFARRGIARLVEVGLGAGLHLGAGTGPAAAATLRLHLPPSGRAVVYLRYDGALLVDETEQRRGQHTITGGVEWGF